jgi:hypothetical protein
MEFKTTEISDIPIIKGFFAEQSYRTCDFSLGTTMIWREYFGLKYAVTDGMLCFCVNSADTCGGCFTLPFGGGDFKAAMASIESYCRERGAPFRFCSVPEEGLALIRDIYGERVTADAPRDWYDYLYEYDSLATFAGKKLSGQRNHVNRFRRLYPDAEFHEMTPDALPAVKEFCREYFALHPSADPMQLAEEKALPELLDHMEEFGCFGGFITIGGRIAAISVGEISGDTMFDHVEKALTEYHGAYQMMVSSFARHFARDGVRYINREEDLGVEGLRTSKLSYKPCKLLKKYNVRIADGKKN